MKNILWKNCNKNCSNYNTKDFSCGNNRYTDLPSLRCLLVSICFLLRGFEIDREKEKVESEDWKE